jgi:hypothetical protein
MFLSLLALASVPLGYWISSLVPNELPIGERWFIVATALFCVPLFWLLPWWQAAIVAGALLLGWYPALIAFAWAAYMPSMALAQLLCVLGVLVGTRWRTEKRPLSQLCTAAAVLAVLVIAPQLI